MNRSHFIRSLKRKFQFCFLLGSFGFIISGCHGGNSTADQQIQPSALQEHVKILAADSLMGRFLGTPEEKMAANYAASQFSNSGISDVEIQRVPVLESKTDTIKSSLRFSGDQPEELKFGIDYMLVGHPDSTDFSLEAPLVFAGFGISAPDLQWDDYADLDVAGKIVLLLFGVPTNVQWETDRTAYYTSFDYKVSNAKEHGAAGVLIGWTQSIESYYPWKYYAPENTNRYDWMNKNNQPDPTSKSNYYLGAISQSTLGKILSLQEINENPEDALSKGSILKLNADSLYIHTVTKHRQFESQNVVASIPGTQGTSATEGIVITAHIDGMGVFHTREHDTIRNGAVDNAAGVAVLLEMARKISREQLKPLRDMIFVVTTGEEEYFVGSNYFVHNYKSPKIVGNLNIDEPAILYKPASIVARGVEHTTMTEAVHRSAKKMGLKIVPDPLPEECFLIRGDSFPFIKAGIPAIWLAPGFESKDPDINGEEIFKKWRVTRYHNIDDDTDQPMNYDACANFAMLNFHIALYLANQNEAPVWKEGDFFANIGM